MRLLQDYMSSLQGLIIPEPSESLVLPTIPFTLYPTDNSEDSDDKKRKIPPNSKRGDQKSSKYTTSAGKRSAPTHDKKKDDKRPGKPAEKGKKGSGKTSKRPQSQLDLELDSGDMVARPFGGEGADVLLLFRSAVLWAEEQLLKPDAVVAAVHGRTASNSQPG